VLAVDVLNASDPIVVVAVPVNDIRLIAAPVDVPAVVTTAVALRIRIPVGNDCTNDVPFAPAVVLPKNSTCLVR